MNSSGLLVTMLAALLALVAVFSCVFASPEPRDKEGWNWALKVGGEGHKGHAHGHGKVEADPKVGHSWTHALEVKGSGHHGHGYGSGHVHVVKPVRREQTHGRD